jgi:predicted lipoprotein
VVGVFVAGWMALIGLVLRLLQQVMSLALLVLSPLTQASPARAKHKLQKLVRGTAVPRHAHHSHELALSLSSAAVCCDAHGTRSAQR